MEGVYTSLPQMPVQRGRTSTSYGDLSSGTGRSSNVTLPGDWRTKDEFYKFQVRKLPQSREELEGKWMDGGVLGWIAGLVAGGACLLRHCELRRG